MRAMVRTARLAPRVARARPRQPAVARPWSAKADAGEAASGAGAAPESAPPPEDAGATASGAESDEPKEDAAAEPPKPLGARLVDAYDAAAFRLRNFDARQAAEALRGEFGQAYAELTGAARGSVLRQKVQFHQDDDAPTEAADPRFSQLLVVEQEDTWAKIRERLKEAPIISDILRGAGKARDAAAATAAGQAVGDARDRAKDAVEGAREVWETSQHPLVYSASSIVDAVTAETDTAAATRELRRLDPRFSLETWRDGVSDELCPAFVDAFVRGDTTTLRPMLGEGLYSRLSQEIRLRKEEGLAYDDARITDVEKVEIIAIQVEDRKAPILVTQFMAQQVNCIRNREGDVVEGAPDDIRAYFYVMAFQRDYDAQSHELVWKVVDFQLGGGEPYY